MTIEHPRFPTPEDERRAALLYAAMRDLADIDNAIPAVAAGDEKAHPGAESLERRSFGK